MADTTIYPPLAAAALIVAGRDLILPRIVQADKKAFSIWAAGRAKADARELEAVTALPGREPTPDRPMTREDYYVALDVAQREATSGHFGYHEAGGMARRATDEGLAYLCWTCLLRGNPVTDPRDAIKFEDVLAIPAVELSAAFNLANADPNSPARANGPGTPMAGTGDS